MKTRELGNSGVRIGAIGLGCMPMSTDYTATEIDEVSARDLINCALDAGITLLDTADVYGPFTNESLLGNALRGRRDDAILATKCGLVVDPDSGVEVHNGRPEHVLAACEESLVRLKTDVIDLYQLHRVDPAIPLEETWGAMAELVTTGKARFLGLSEVSVEQLELADSVHPVTSVQSELSLWTQDALTDVVPWCAKNSSTFIPFAPLGRGFLTGQITSANFEAGDFRRGNPRFTDEAIRTNQTIVDGIKVVAQEAGASPAQVALAWLLAQYDRCVPIPGTKRTKYLLENSASVDLRLSDEQMDRLNGLPTPAGSRY